MGSNDLKEKDKDTLNQAQSCSSTDLTEFLEREVTKAKEKRLKIKLRNGANFFVRDALEKIAHWVNKLVQVGDIAVQYDPGHATLPWAAVRLVLQVSISNVQQHASVFEGTEVALHLLVWARVQERLQMSNVSETAPQLRMELEGLYATIFSFLAKTVRFLKKDRTRRLITTTFSLTTRYKDHIERMKAYKHKVESLAVQMSHNTLLNAEGSLNQLRKILDGLEAPVRQTDEHVKDTLEKLKARERNVILDWVSPVAFTKPYEEIVRRALEGTGGWLFEHPDFIKWRHSSMSQILWLHGMPGSGKSTLTSILVRSLIQSHDQYRAPFPVFFHCLRGTSQPDGSQPNEVLRSLLRQSSSLPGDLPVHPKLQERYEKSRIAGDLSGVESVEILLNTIDDRPMTFIIVDALDESIKSLRHELVDAFETILTEANSLVKIFVSSRNDQDIAVRLKNYPQVTIDANNNQSDIEKYVENEVDRLIARKRLLPTEHVGDALKNQIKNSLSKGARGMFKWVELQLQYLCTLRIPENVIERLDKMPNELGKIFKDLYCRSMEQMHPIEREIAMTVFAWLLVGQEELQSEDFISLISSSVGSAVDFTKETLLDLCFNLVVFDLKWNSFRFAHLSVREFFEQNGLIFSKDDCHSYVIGACLRILALSTWQNYKVLEFVDHNWPFHASQCKDLDDIQAFASFCNHRSVIFIAWSERVAAQVERGEISATRGWYRHEPAIERREKNAETICQPPHPFLTCCAWGLIEYVKKLVMEMEGQTPDSIRNYYRETGLHHSSRNGHVDIVSFLLTQGSDVNAVDAARRSALAHSAGNGYTHVVELLLKAGIDVNARNVTGKSALTYSSDGGYVDIVRLLLKAGANVNPNSDRDVSALSLASERGHVEIVQELLDNGADVNFVPNNNGSSPALHGATFGGHDKVVEVLLKNGADVNLENGEHRIYALHPAVALHTAVLYGHTRIVQILLRNSADVNFQCAADKFTTALHIAACKDSDEMFLMLLDHNADVNLQGGFWGNALGAAVSRDDHFKVITLLTHGARVNGDGGRSGYALQAAASQGHINLVNFLLTAGADPNVPGIYESALLAAINGLVGRLERPESKVKPILECILQSGKVVDLNLCGQRGSILHVAIYFELHTILEWLIKEPGIDVNNAGPGTTPLYDAVDKHYTRAVQYLLAHPDINIWAENPGGKHRFASDLAVATNNKQIQKMLEDKAKEISRVTEAESESKVTPETQQ